MKIRFLSMLLCLAMLLGTAPIGVSAEELNAPETEPPVIAEQTAENDISVQANAENVAEVIHSNGTAAQYSDIDAAFAEAQNAENAEVKLLADLTTENTVTVEGGTFTIDLNGKKWENTSESTCYALCVKGGNVTVTSTNGTGTINGYIKTTTSFGETKSEHKDAIKVENNATVHVKNGVRMNMLYTAENAKLTLDVGVIITFTFWTEAYSIAQFLTDKALQRCDENGKTEEEYVPLNDPYRTQDTGCVIVIEHKNCLGTAEAPCEICGGDSKQTEPEVRYVAMASGKRYERLSAAIDAAKNGGEVELLNITTENVTITDGTNVTVDLAGNLSDIEWNGVYTTEATKPVPLTVNGGSITLKNGKLAQNFIALSNSAVIITGGSLTVGEGMTIIGSRHSDTSYYPAIDLQGGSLTLSVGTKLGYGMKVPEGHTLAEYLPKGTAFTVDGRVINGYVQECIGDFTLTVDEHTHSIGADGKCACGYEMAASVTSNAATTDYKTLGEALSAAKDGETVKVLKDNCSINNGGHNTFLKKNITLDLNDKTVKTDELIIISGNVTNVAIKNGTIYGTRKHNKDSVLITFQSNTIFNTLTLDNVRVIQTDENNVALYVYCGKLVMADGEIDGGLLIGEYGSAELSGGTFKNTNGAVISDTKTGGGIARFLKSGYAYKKEDDTFIDLSANPTLIPIGTTVTVAPCTHGFESGKCKYCGYVCKHEHIINNKCSDCGAVLLAQVKDAYDDSITYGMYLTLEEAFASINQGEARTVVYYGADDHTFENDIEIKGTVYYYSTGGKSLKFNNEKSFVVKDGGALYGTAYGYISAVTLEAGSVYSSESDFVVGTLTVYDDSKILINNKLQNGNFEKIVILNGDKKVGDILHTTVHRTFRHKGADGSWATGAWVTDEELGRTTIENVSIVKKPFCNESITVSPEGELTYKKALNVTMSADKTDLDGDYGDTTYEWFATHSPNVVLSTNSSYTTTLSVAGTYEFGCRITRGGYTRTVTKQITVNKGNSEYTTEPKAKENLVYSGDEQELVDKGTLSTDQKILYKLDNGGWSENIPKAKDAGEYTVYYKVDENDNYSGIAEKDFKVTIAKKVLKGISTDTIEKQYDGKKELPIVNINKFICDDNTEIDLRGYMYNCLFESASAGENKKVTLTVNLSDLAKNYVFDNGTAEKVFEKTGTITKAKAPNTKLESLTIVRNLKRNYTFDVSKLLGDVPYGTTYGKITYKLDSVDIPDFYDESKKAEIDENGILTLPIQESVGTGDGIVTVKATTDNYKGVSGEDEIILTIQINAMAKIALKNGAPTLNPTSIAYGQKLGNISLSGSLEDYDGNTVKGTFSWKNPDIIPSAGAASGEWIFTPDDDEFYMYETRNGTASFTVEPKDITGANHEDFNLEYNGNVQTPAAKVTIDGMEVTGKWSNVTNVSDKTSFTANGNFKGTIENVETNMRTKDITNAVITLSESHKYNGSEQTQGITSVTIDGLTLSESDYDISDNKATDVKADGNYVLTITGKGNFNGTKTAEWNIKPTEPTENTEKKTTARVRRGRTLAEATVTNGELFGIDGTTILEGTFAWVDDTKVMNANGTEKMTFTPNNKNYVPITIDVAVSTYSSGGGGSSSSSSASSYTVKFDTNGGSRISDVKVSKNETISEPTEPKKDGFEFAGWFTDKELKNKYDFDTKVTKNFTLYAAWTEAKTEPNPNPTDKPENPGSTKPDQTNPEKENQFDDVSKDDWYYDDVKSAVEKGLFNGTGSKTFAPNDSITRGMFVTVLYRAEGEPKVNTAIPFVDVSADSYFANAVIWAEQNGIVTGVSETEFAPNDNITREQIAAIMFRFAKYKGAAPTGAWAIRLDYADLESVSDYAAEAVMYCTLKGIMQGKDNNLFAPQDSATRAEIAAILNRFLKANK